jgi:hypothetical protein
MNSGARSWSADARPTLEIIGVSPPEEGTERLAKVSQAGFMVDQPYSLCGQMGSSGGLFFSKYYHYAFISGRGVEVRRGAVSTLHLQS